MPRAILPAGMVASLAIAWAPASSAAAGWTGVSGVRTPTAGRTAAQDSGRITLRLRFRVGPWKRSLYLKLVKTQLTSFSVCAIRNWQATRTFDCASGSDRLLGQTGMRLEQSPVARALVRRDSPGWGMLGTSGADSLGAVLSNSVSGNRPGKFDYRVTLRDKSGHVLTSSNKVTVVWHT